MSEKKEIPADSVPEQVDDDDEPDEWYVERLTYLDLAKSCRSSPDAKPRSCADNIDRLQGQAHIQYWLRR